jgi:hypothetical protein
MACTVVQARVAKCKLNRVGVVEVVTGDIADALQPVAQGAAMQ